MFLALSDTSRKEVWEGGRVVLGVLELVLERSALGAGGGGVWGSGRKFQETHDLFFLYLKLGCDD